MREAPPNKKLKQSLKKSVTPCKPHWLVHTNAPAPPLPQHPPRPAPSSNSSQQTEDALPQQQEEQSAGILLAAHEELAASMLAAEAQVHPGGHRPELMSA